MNYNEIYTCGRTIQYLMRSQEFKAKFFAARLPLPAKRESTSAEKDIICVAYRRMHEFHPHLSQNTELDP
jgi:hypothetical protein